MIITLRGASGSGKSTLVRAIMESYSRFRYRHKEGRKKPYYQICGRPGLTNLVVPGHYEITNGGVDTLRTLDEAYDIARWADTAMKYHVLMEGKCMSDGTKHVAALQHEKRDVRVVHVNTSLFDCQDSVLRRGHNISAESIAKTYRKIETNMETFRCMNIPTFSGSRDECLQQVRTWLGLS